jgi:hypothetical protein
MLMSRTQVSIAFSLRSRRKCSLGIDVLGDDLGRHQPDLVGLVVERRDG